MTTGASPTCQACGSLLTRSLVDLGVQPLANSYVPRESAGLAEPRFPLHARVCDTCLLVQVDSVTAPETIFNEDYAYHSSFSESWLAHCRLYAEQMRERFGLNSESLVVEIAKVSQV